MATIDNRVAATGVVGKAGFRAAIPGQIFTLTKTLNFATNTKGDGTAYTNTAADTLQLIDIPAGTVVLDAYARVTTVMGAAGTMTLGDGGDADGYIKAFDLNALAILPSDGAYFVTTEVAPVAPFISAKGKAYPSAGVLSGLLAGTLADLGIVNITLVCTTL